MSSSESNAPRIHRDDAAFAGELRSSDVLISPKIACFWPPFSLGWLFGLCLIASGCSTISVPSFSLPSNSLETIGVPSTKANSSKYVPVGGANLPSSTFTEDVYYKVKQAKQNQGVVLQVLGDDAPLRVLPLPSVTGEMVGGKPPTVYVSTLLKQTGILDKIGRAQAALYRASPENFEGIRMDVHFEKQGDRPVRPETDYALQPGDRLVIGKDDNVGLGSLVDLALGR